MEFGRKSKDQLVWNGTSSGVFLVKSAYYLEKERNMQDKGGSLKASLYNRMEENLED